MATQKVVTITDRVVQSWNGGRHKRKLRFAKAQGVINRLPLRRGLRRTRGRGGRSGGVPPHPIQAPPPSPRGEGSSLYTPSPGPNMKRTSRHTSRQQNPNRISDVFPWQHNKTKTLTPKNYLQNRKLMSTYGLQKRRKTRKQQTARPRLTRHGKP